jgi:2-keto-4-pentenoate hydratase/2-oxohepta-3-ene-1,7-dioic acid hydratase in catechol pathway
VQGISGKHVSQTAPPTPFKLGTFSAAGCAPFGGLIVDERALAFNALGDFLRREQLDLSCDGSTLSVLDAWESNFPVLQRIAEALHTGQDAALASMSAPLDALMLHAPVASRNVICSGANYFKHVVDIVVAQVRPETEGMTPEQRRAFGIAKMTDRRLHGTPFFFIKANSTMVGPFDAVSLPPDVTTMDWELELGVVIGKRARFVTRERALDHVAGYMVVNDLTIRERVNRKDMQEMGMDWVGSKCAPTALPTGPYLVPAAFVGDPQKLHITLKHNGRVMQDEGADDMIFDCARLIETLSKFMALLPGDLICTGSPSGNGIHHGVLLKPGDVMEGTISGPLEGLGTQRNSCHAEA